MMLAECMLGHHGQTHTGCHRTFDRFIAAELKPYDGMKTLAGEPGIARHTGAGTSFARDETLVAQHLHIKTRLSGKTVTAWRDKHQTVGQELMSDQRQLIGWLRHDVKIIAVIHQPLKHTVTIEHLK
ncbi:hypothetical protein N7E01_04595 [Neopusillimonas aromaticivorans]|nr:hypothetical protein [Neopusillimonas aromaticivorans]WJJ94322.1 hypothetical protein N7E01_04595 [Neopusillimonas aromaticivorans]